MNSFIVEKNDKSEKINDLKIFLLCISSGAIGFSLIGILPYEIPLFFRVFIAFLLLGIPLLDFNKIVLFGIAGGLGYFIKDYIFWDLFSFKWTSAYGNLIDIPLLTGIIIGTFLSIVLWNRKAIEIFPLTGALAFFTAPFIRFCCDFRLSDFGAGVVFGAGMCLYLFSIGKTISIPRKIIRKILLVLGILLLFIFGSFIIIGYIGSMGHPPHVGQTVVSVGEVVEKKGVRIAVTNYTFLQNNTGRVLRAGITIQDPVDVSQLRLSLWYRQDEYLGIEINEIRGNLEKIGPNTGLYYISFENLPERLRTKDFAVVWEVWTSSGIEYVIWRTR
jgi:hypothetical protein